MPSVAFAFPLSGLLFLIGYVLLTYELKKVDSVSKLSAYVLIVGTIIFGIGLSGIFPMIVVRTGAVLFGLGLILTGHSLFRKQSHESY